MFSEVPYISIDRVHIMVSTVQFSEKMIKSLKSQHNIKGSPYLVNTRSEDSEDRENMLLSFLSQKPNQKLIDLTSLSIKYNSFWLRQELKKC